MTRPGGKRIQLSPLACAALVDLHYGGRRPTDPDGLLRLADSVDTLAHESAHASGVFVEAKAECHGIQRLERAARDLGAAPASAAELERAYWEDYDALDAELRSPECADGGDFDLRPGSHGFP